MLTQAVTYTYVQGDTLPVLAFRITTRATGVKLPLDITGYSAKLAFKKPSGVSVVKTATVDGPNGLLTFQWASGDLDTPGNFQMQLQLISAAGNVQSWQQLYLTVTARAYSGSP